MTNLVEMKNVKELDVKELNAIDGGWAVPVAVALYLAISGYIHSQGH